MIRILGAVGSLLSGAPPVHVVDPEINISQIRMGGGVAGMIFTVGTMAIFLVGIPWYGAFLFRR
jgi:hypothetical protein